jgi:hypothetical protein
MQATASDAVQFIEYIDVGLGALVQNNEVRTLAV